MNFEEEQEMYEEVNFGVNRMKKAPNFDKKAKKSLETLGKADRKYQQKLQNQTLTLQPNTDVFALNSTLNKEEYFPTLNLEGSNFMGLMDSIPNSAQDSWITIFEMNKSKRVFTLPFRAKSKYTSNMKSEGGTQDGMMLE